MARALVLGATGHIGSHVVRALLDRGYAVRASYRNPRYAFLLDGLPVERIPLDLEDARSLAHTAEGCEVVFVCAGYYPRWTDRRQEAIQRGLAQIQRVFDALRRSRPQRIVYTSSAATITRVPGRASTEADREPWPATRRPHHLRWGGFAALDRSAIQPPARPQVVGRRPLYSTVKIAMEHAVQQEIDGGLPIVIVNPSVCIGEYDAHPFSGRLVLAFAGARRRLPAYFECAFNVVYTGDVGVGHVLAAERGTPGERYLLTGEHTTMSAFARLVAAQAQVPPPRWEVAYPLAMAASMVSEGLAALTRAEPLLPRQVIRHARIPQRLDGSKAQRELGLSFTPMDEAIRRAVSWFRDHHYL